MLPKSDQAPFLKSPVVDALVIPPSDALKDSLGYLFAGARNLPESAEEYIESMDEAGVALAVLAIQSDDDIAWVRDAVAAHPGRFAVALSVDPRNGMSELRRISEYVASFDVKCLRLGPWRIERPPTDRIYWPVYAKAVELGLPIQINVGIPGPKKPGWTQDPIYIDEVCYHFPELTIVMTHVGYPWIGTVLRNLLKWDNCYLAINSYAPKHLPEDLISFMNKQRPDKVLYATEFPMMSHMRTLKELKDLGLRENVVPQLLFENSRRVFALD